MPGRKLLPFAVVVVAVLTARSANADETSKEHPLRPAIKFAQECLDKIQALDGYEARFYKKEVVGNSTVSHEMNLKLRHKPFSVYLHFIKPYDGREVIYVEGQNAGKLIAHEAGLLSFAGSMELVPTDTMAMTGNRYPITMAGIANTLEIMIERWEGETKFGETEVKYYKEAKLGSMTCRVIETSHPQPRRQFTYHKVLLWVDKASGIPVRMQKYGFPKKKGGKPPVIEDYTYMDVKTDVKLTDADFDRNNENYNF